MALATPDEEASHSLSNLAQAYRSQADALKKSKKLKKARKCSAEKGKLKVKKMSALGPPWTPKDGLLRSMGAAGESAAAITTLLKPSPHAYEPDVQIPRIRLSGKTSRLHPRHVVPKPAQAYEPKVPVKICASIAVAIAKIGERGWQGDTCMITPDEAGRAMLEKALKGVAYDCVVIGGGLGFRQKAWPYSKWWSTPSIRQHLARQSHSTRAQRTLPTLQPANSMPANGVQNATTRSAYAVPWLLSAASTWHLKTR